MFGALVSVDDGAVDGDVAAGPGVLVDELGGPLVTDGLELFGAAVEGFGACGRVEPSDPSPEQAGSPEQ